MSAATPGRKAPRDGHRPVVLVIGGGFGGLAAVKGLARSGAIVVLVDRANYHLFQPLLYQVATAVLSAPDIAFPIRRIFRRSKNVYVFRDHATAVDLASHHVAFREGTDAHRFDYLVLAAGAGQSYFGHDEWTKLAPGMKTLEDASGIRARVLQAFEDAEAEDDPEALRAHLTFVIVGAGPTGVELAGAIKELAVDAIVRDFRRFDSSKARVILVEATDRVLPAMSHESSRAALRSLESLGVEVRLNARVSEVDKEGVAIGSERIRADTVLWAAGVSASPLGATLGVPTDRTGRVIVEPDLSVPGHPNVFVIGDMAAAAQPDGSFVPGLAPAAIQMGHYVARIIRRELAGRGPSAPARAPFRYVDKGTMATIGRARAVADIGKLRLHGLIAWLAWGLLHLMLLIGFRNRIIVMVSWTFAYIAYTKGARIITGEPPSRVAKPVEVVVRKADGVDERN